MGGIMILAVAAVFLLIGVPIGMSICIAIIATLRFFPVSQISFVTQCMYSGLDSFPLLAIPCFMLAGSIMGAGGLSKRLINVAMRLVGNTSGGLGAVTIVACLFFGAISGSAPATVAAIGGIMLPYMLKYNYDSDYSTGLVAVAGGLGVIIPPSIPFVVYGVTANISVGKIFIAGFIPGILIAVSLIVVNYFLSKKRGFEGINESFSFKTLLSEIWDAKWALIMPLIILGGIYGGFFTPTEAAVVAIVYGIIIGLFVYKELTFKGIVDMLDHNTSFVGAIMLTFAPASALGAVLSLMNIPQTITAALQSMTDSKIVILLLVNIVLILAGMVIDTCSAIIILTPILLPAVKAFGVDPVHFGLIITVNLAIGFVTPPVAGNLFVASVMTKRPIEAIAKAALPFIAAMFVCLMLITYIEPISLWLPNLLGM